MKYTKILVALLSCSSLSCTDMEFVDTDTSGSGDSYSSQSFSAPSGNPSLQTVQLASLQSGTNSIISAIQTTPNSYLFTENGLTYAKLLNTTGSAAFRYLNNIRILTPTAIGNFPYDAVRAQVGNDLNKFQVSTAFRNNLLSAFDFIRNIDSKSFSAFETFFENKLTFISITRGGTSAYTELEKFALTQAYYTVLNITRWVYQHPTPNPSSGSCTPQTRAEWKQVAEGAFTTGMMSGARLGWSGAVAGAIATTAAGNPVVGGVVGGIAGFVTGFLGGAIAGGGIKLMWLCLSNKLFTPMMTLSCGGKIYYANTAQPPSGCIEVATGAGAVDLKSIVDFPLTPNKGSQGLNSAVVSDLNWLLHYL